MHGGGQWCDVNCRTHHGNAWTGWRHCMPNCQWTMLRSTHIKFEHQVHFLWGPGTAIVAQDPSKSHAMEARKQPFFRMISGLPETGGVDGRCRWLVDGMSLFLSRSGCGPRRGGGVAGQWCTDAGPSLQRSNGAGVAPPPPYWSGAQAPPVPRRGRLVSSVHQHACRHHFWRCGSPTF